MRATKSLKGSWSSLLAAVMIFLSCCSTNTDSTITITLTARDSQTGEALDNSNFRSAGIRIGQNTHTITRTEEAGTVKTYEVTREGYWKNTKTITFTKDRSKNIFLDKKR